MPVLAITVINSSHASLGDHSDQLISCQSWWSQWSTHLMSVLVITVINSSHLRLGDHSVCCNWSVRGMAWVQLLITLNNLSQFSCKRYQLVIRVHQCPLLLKSRDDSTLSMLGQWKTDECHIRWLTLANRPSPPLVLKPVPELAASQCCGLGCLKLPSIE